MKRRLALLLTVPLLTSCTIEDVASVLGPRPDTRIAELADRAANDAAALSGEQSELRARHAEELRAEIARLCGTHADGSVPESCAFETTITQFPEADIGESLTLTLDAAVPAESRALTIRQAVDLAALSPTELPKQVALDDETDLASARELLAREYATAWGLGVARAHLVAARYDALDELLDAHEARIRSLRAVLAPHGEAPVAEAGYELEGLAEPQDSATAEDFVASLETGLTEAWLAAAVSAVEDPWQEFAVRATAEAEAAARAYSGL